MRKLTAVICLLMASSFLYAQGPEFMHSLGGKYFFYGNTDGVTGAGILYSPRINFSSEGNSTLSVGTRLGLGFSLQSGAGGSSSSLVLDLPVLAEYNFGFGSTKEADGSFGGYIGAGYGLHRASYATNYVSGSATVHGPVFGGGIRALIGSIGAFELGASYSLDLKSKVKESKMNIFGISVSYLFGFRESSY